MTCFIINRLMLAMFMLNMRIYLSMFAGILIYVIFFSTVPLPIAVQRFMSPAENASLLAKKRGYKPSRSEWPSLSETGTTLLEAWPALFLVVVIVGGIRFAIFTPTKAGAIATVATLIIGVFVYREMRLRDVTQAFADTARRHRASAGLQPHARVDRRFRPGWLALSACHPDRPSAGHLYPPPLAGAGVGRAAGGGPCGIAPGPGQRPGRLRLHRAAARLSRSRQTSSARPTPAHPASCPSPSGAVPNRACNGGA